MLFSTRIEVVHLGMFCKSSIYQKYTQSTRYAAILNNSDNYHASFNV